MKGKPLDVYCPICGQSLNINTFVPGEQMRAEAEGMIDVKPDDITFCFSCRTVLVMNKDLQPIIPNEDELYQIIHDEDFHHFVNQIDLARRNKPNMN